MGIRVKHSSAPAVPLDVAYTTGTNQAKERHMDRALKLAMMNRGRGGGGRGGSSKGLPPSGVYGPRYQEPQGPSRAEQASLARAGRLHEQMAKNEAIFAEQQRKDRMLMAAQAEEQQKQQMGTWFNRGQGERARLRQLQGEKQQQIDALETAVREGKMRLGDEHFVKAMGMIDQKYPNLDSVYIPNEEDEMRFAEKRKPYQLQMNGKTFGFDSPKDYFDAMKVKGNTEYQAARTHADYHKAKMDWIKDNKEQIAEEFEKIKEQLDSVGAPIASDPVKMAKLRRDIEAGYAHQFESMYPPPMAPGVTAEDMAKNPSVRPDKPQAPAAMFADQVLDTTQGDVDALNAELGTVPNQAAQAPAQAPRQSVVPDAIPPMEAAKSRNFAEMNKYASAFKSANTEPERQAVLTELLEAYEQDKSSEAGILLRRLIYSLTDPVKEDKK